MSYFKIQLFLIVYLFIAYAIGMVLTFIVLALMKMGQPALLYLVPCTLITSSLIAWKRKEMKKFWKGSNYQVGWISGVFWF